MDNVRAGLVEFFGPVLNLIKSSLSHTENTVNEFHMIPVYPVYTSIKLFKDFAVQQKYARQDIDYLAADFSSPQNALLSSWGGKLAAGICSHMT